jgi:alkylated DNA repair dioxygenase AlkB
LVREYFDVPDREKYCNHLLINRYSSNQRISSHKDDEPELVAPIISLSLGASATFRFSRSYNICSALNSPETGINVRLDDSDLLIGNREFFNQMYHCTSYPSGGERINLTWRTVR